MTLEKLKNQSEKVRIRHFRRFKTSEGHFVDLPFSRRFSIEFYPDLELQANGGRTEVTAVNGGKQTTYISRCHPNDHFCYRDGIHNALERGRATGA